MRVFERQTLGLTKDDDFLTGNIGGGVKVMFGCWGVRGDYQLFALRSKNEAPRFIGSDPRYAHRVYGASCSHLVDRQRCAECRPSGSLASYTAGATCTPEARQSDGPSQLWHNSLRSFVLRTWTR